MRLKTLFVFVLIILLSNTGCSVYTTEKKTETVVTENPVNGITKDIGNDKVVILFFSNIDYDESKLKEVAYNFADRGINVQFKQFYTSSKTLESISKEYINKIQESISSNEIDAFIVLSSMEQFMAKEGLTDNLMDISSILSKAAPNYFSQLVQYGMINNSEKQITYIPIGLVETPYEIGRQIVVVKGDIAEKYNAQIDNLSGYGKFLNEIKQEQGITPGFIVDYTSYVSLVLQELGYLLIDMTLNTDRLSFFALSNDDKKMEDPIPFEEIPGVREQLTKINNWIKQGLLYYPQRGQTIDKAKLASMVVPIGSYKNSIDFRYLYSDKNSKVVFPLYSNLPASKKVKTVYNKLYIPKNAKQPNEVIKLVEWINADQKNYDVMRYGQMNKDYTIENGKIQLVTNGNIADDQLKLSKAYYNWAGSTYFVNDKYERLHVSVPDNYESTLKSFNGKLNELLPLEKAYQRSNIILDKELKNIKQSVNGIDDILVKRQQYCLDFLMQYLGSENFPDRYDQFIQAQDKESTKLIKNYYKEIINRLKN